MNANEAMEILADPDNENPEEIRDAVTYLRWLENDVTLLQNRCYVMTNGMLCSYCGMIDRCNKKENGNETN